MPTKGTTHTEDAKRRIRETTSLSAREFWNSPHGREIRLARRSEGLERKIVETRAKLDSMESEFASVSAQRRELAEQTLAFAEQHVRELSAA